MLKDQITRGRQIFVSGRLSISEKGYISVIADHIELLARPKPKEKFEIEEKEVPEEKEEKESK